MWKSSIMYVDGREVFCEGCAVVPVVHCGKTIEVECIVLPRLVSSVDLVLGMDFIRLIGGVEVTDGGIRFPVIDQKKSSEESRREKNVVASLKSIPGLTVKDFDFEATFDGNGWSLSWQ